MKRPGHGSFDTRALEFAVTALAAYLGADTIRAVLGPLLRNLSLLFGL